MAPANGRFESGPGGEFSGRGASKGWSGVPQTSAGRAPCARLKMLKEACKKKHEHVNVTAECSFEQNYKRTSDGNWMLTGLHWA